MILQLEELVTSSGKLVFPLLFSTVNPLVHQNNLGMPCHIPRAHRTILWC